MVRPNARGGENKKVFPKDSSRSDQIRQVMSGLFAGHYRAHLSQANRLDTLRQRIAVLARVTTCAKVVLATWRGPISTTAACLASASVTIGYARRAIILANYPRRG